MLVINVTMNLTRPEVELLSLLKSKMGRNSSITPSSNKIVIVFGNFLLLLKKRLVVGMLKANKIRLSKTK